jgi:hypothetical protein
MKEKFDQAFAIFHNVVAENVRSVTRKNRTAMLFLERRAAVLDIHRTMANMTESEMINKLKEILGIEGMEAAEILHAESQQRSLHE